MDATQFKQATKNAEEVGIKEVLVKVEDLVNIVDYIDNLNERLKQIKDSEAKTKTELRCLIRGLRLDELV